MKALDFKRSLLAIALVGICHPASANPTGPAVARGAALISNHSASVLQVVNTPGTIMHWDGFSIAAGETTRFVQDSAASAVLNRVVGSSPSAILGRLESNGRVFLINPNGIVFGGSSVVDVAGLIASTRDISDANFLAGNYLFDGAGNGAITVQNGASITTANYSPSGGQVWLFAKNVTQEAGSNISAPQGQVVLAAGTQVQVGTSGLGNMTFNVTTDGTNTLNSLGSIAASQGAVGLFADYVNHSGSINAGAHGQVAMNATSDLTLTDGSTTTAPDGTITLRGGAKLEVTPAASITADGANGKIGFESNNLLVYPSGKTHAVDGQVSFNQYQPSQFASDGVSTIVSPGGPGILAEIVYRRPDGTYGFRYELQNFPIYQAEELVLDPTGRVVSGPTLLQTYTFASFPTLAQYLAIFRQGLAPGHYETGYYPTNSRVPAAGGGSVAVLPDATGATTLGFYSSSGALTIYPGVSVVIPLTDSTVATVGINGGNGGNLPFTVDFLGQSGASTGRQLTIVSSTGVNLSTGKYHPSPWIGFAEPSGGFTLLGYLIGSLPFGTGNTLACCGYSEHFSKVVPAYTPTQSLTGSAGPATSFATRPGVSPGDFTPPPATPPASPPLVGRGDPSSGTRNINFTLSGCNAHACTDEYLASIAALNAARASEQAGRGQMDDQLSAAAVLALAELAGRPGVISPDGALGTATLMRDDDSLRQLVIGYGNFATMTPRERLEVFERWKNIYTNAQVMGQNAITVADVANNIVTEDEQLAFMNAIASFQMDFQE